MHCKLQDECFPKPTTTGGNYGFCIGVSITRILLQMKFSFLLATTVYFDCDIKFGLFPLNTTKTKLSILTCSKYKFQQNGAYA